MTREHDTQEADAGPQDQARVAAVLAVPGRRRPGVRRALAALAVLVMLVVGGAGFALFQLQSERNSTFLRTHLADLVMRALGPGHELSLGSATMTLSGLTPRFTLGDLVILNTQTRGEARLKQAFFSISPFSLWRLSPEARVVAFDGLTLVLPDAGGESTTLHAGEVLALLRGTLGAVHMAVSGEDAAFASLQRIDGSGVELYRRGAGEALLPLQKGLGLHLSRTEGGFAARITREGGQTLNLQARTRRDEHGPSVEVETGDVRAGTLFDIVGASIAGIDPALALDLRLSSRAGEGGALAESLLRIAARGGRIELPDPDMVPFVLDEALVELALRPGDPLAEIRRLVVRFNETHVEARGTLVAPARLGAGLQVRLKADKAVLDRLSPQEDVVELDFAEAEGELSSDFTAFRLDRLDIAEDEGRARLSGRFSIANGGLIETRLEGGGFRLRKALRIWPIWVAPNVRYWLIDHAMGGRLATITLQTRLEGEVLRNAFAKKPVPAEALSVDFRIEEGELKPLADALPLVRVRGGGRATGRRADITIEEGTVEAGAPLTLRGARLVVADTARRPAQMDMSLPVSGSLEALMRFLNAPSLRALTGLPTDLAVRGGSFDGAAQISLPLDGKGKDAKIDLKADLKGVVVDNIIKGEKLEGGTLTMVSRAGVLGVKGEAKLFGVPGQVDFRVDPAKGALAQVKMTLDDATLAKRGIDIRHAVTGALGVTASMPLGKPDAPVEFEVDLARASVNAGVSGVTKPAGQPGKAKFSLKSHDNSQQIEALEVDFGPLSLRGKAELAKDGTFRRGEFSAFKLSGGDNARLVAERAGKGYRLSLRGNAFDARPFLKGFQSGRIERGASAPVDFDLDLATTVLVGFGGELLGGAEIRMARRGSQITELDLKGQFGGAPTRVTSTVQGKNTQLRVNSQDGGALARFLDLYSRAYGGVLTAEIMLMPNDAQRGMVQMRDFTLRGEAGLRSVSSTAREGQAIMRGTDDVPFTKLRAEFLRKPGRLEIPEAVMWGPQVGGTMEGVLDYAADRVSIKGTFVPAYALNNLFAQVPILGPLLGGGQYEGLFAAPFIITGKASAPELKTNPVSVIAPGFLRKLFEIQREK